MKTSKIGEMKGGWFVGNFDPSLIKTNDCEVAYKTYARGTREHAHYHKIATEITVITKGKVKMFNRIFEEGDIIIVEPGDVTSFEALDDAGTVVVKFPGANDDKYLVEE